MIRALGVLLVLAIALPSAVGCGGGSDRPTGQPGDRPAEGDRPRVVSATDPPIKVARREQVMVIHDLEAKQTRLLFRPKASYLNLNGRRLVWAEGKTICYCDLPDGEVTTFERDQESGRVAADGDRIAYESKAGITVRNLADNTTRDFKLHTTHWLALDGDLLVQVRGAMGNYFSTVRLDTGTVTSPKDRIRGAAGLAVRDGRVAYTTMSRANDQWKTTLTVLDTATGQSKSFSLPRTYGFLRFVGDRLVGASSTARKTSLWTCDPATGEMAQATDVTHFNVARGYGCDGRRLAWASDTTVEGKSKPVVWVWDSADGSLRDVAVEVQANLPKMEMVASDESRKLFGGKATPTLRRTLGHKSLTMGGGFIVWSEEWQVLWTVPAKG